MKKALFLTTSRKRTLWTGMSDATPLQSFIENRIAQEYGNKYLLMKDTD